MALYDDDPQTRAFGQPPNIVLTTIPASQLVTRTVERPDFVQPAREVDFFDGKTIFGISQLQPTDDPERLVTRFAVVPDEYVDAAMNDEGIVRMLFAMSELEEVLET